MLVSLNDALVHDIVGNLVCLGLDHDYLLVGGSDGGRHAVGFALFLGGIKQILLAVPAENDACNRTVKGDIGDGDCCRCADHCGDLGAAVTVNGQHLAGNDNIVAQVAGEQGTHGAVDKAGSQNCGQAGLTLAAHERAGNAADSVELLVKINCEREVIDAVLGPCRSGAGDQNGGLAVGDQNCGVAKLRHLADLHLEGAAFVLDLKLSVIGEFFLLDYHLFAPFVFL